MSARRRERAQRAVSRALPAVLLCALLGACTAGSSAAPSAGPSAGHGTASQAASPGQAGGGEGATPTPMPTVTGSSGKDGTASEVLPGNADTPPLPLGSQAAGGTLAQAPADASATDTLVAGFPTTVVPVPDGIALVSSSVASQGDHVQVGLQGTAHGEPGEVAAAYTTRMAGLGYGATSAPASPGASATQFSRGADAVVLTVTSRPGGGTEVSLTGALVVGG